MARSNNSNNSNDDEIELGEVNIPGSVADSTPGDFNGDNSDGDSSDDVDAVGDREETTAVDTSHLPESDGDGVDLSEPIDPVHCPVCEQEFEADRGMRIHFGKKHQGKELDDDGNLVNDDSDNEDTEAGTSVIQPEDAPDDATTPDDGDDGMSCKEYGDEMQTVDDKWEEARTKYKEASINGHDTTRRDALSHTIAALEAETLWMSVRERSGEGYQDLWRWVSGEGWQDDAHGWIAERMSNELDTESSRREVAKAKHHLAVRNKVDQDELNAGEYDATLIPVGNGVINVDDVTYDAATMTVDLSTVTLDEMDPDYRFTYRIDTEWDPDAADITGLDEWASEIVNDADDVRTIWEFAGHSLHPRYPIDGFAVMVGDGGSGKSMMLKVLKEMIGEEKTSSLSISKMETNDFVGPHVVNGRANINTELNGTKIQSIEQLKKLSAGEQMYVEQKREKGYEAHNDATMIFASDNPPAFPDDQRNRALYRRLFPVEFPCKFVDDPDPSNPYELQYRSKPVVEEELQADARIKAALVRAVEGLVRILREGGFTTETSGKERLARYEAFADPARHFTQHCLVDAGPDSQIESGVFQHVLDSFCEKQDHAGKSLKQLKNVLDDETGMSYSHGRTRHWSDEQIKHTVYKGLKFSPEAIRHHVPEHAMEHLDLSALHGDEDDTRDSALTETIDDEDGDGGLSQEERVEVLKDVVDDVADEHDAGAPIDEIRDLAEERGVSEDKFRDEFDRLYRKGDVYEPATGRWRAA